MRITFAESPCARVGETKARRNEKLSSDCFLVREVGFEPTNPYGTGASGLRFHDPFSKGLFDLAWQLPHTKSLPVSPMDQTRAPNWLSPHRPKSRPDQEYRKNV